MEIKEQEKELIIKLAPYFWRFKNEAKVNDSAIKWVWEMLQQDDIKEALSLLNMKHQGKLVKLSDNQEIPEIEINGVNIPAEINKVLSQLNWKRVETL